MSQLDSVNCPKTRMATVVAKVATDSRQMATDFGKMATVVLNLATGPAQMATQAQMIAVILIKAVIKCIGRDGNQECSFSRDEKVVEIVGIRYKSRRPFQRLQMALTAPKLEWPQL